MKWTTLIVPGWTNSGPDHWQSHWERDNPEYRRVIQRDWDHPDPIEWVATLKRSINEAEHPVVIVAHSLGCLAVTRWATTDPQANISKIAGAFFVAPADVDRADVADVLWAWRPIPLTRLPFPTTLVASRSDEYLAFERARVFATAWGSNLIDAGNAGHLNTAAGYGPWPEGHRWLVEFIESVFNER
jgi:uncharacterized protein